MDTSCDDIKGKKKEAIQWKNSHQDTNWYSTFKVGVPLALYNEIYLEEF